MSTSDAGYGRDNALPAETAAVRDAVMVALRQWPSRHARTFGSLITAWRKLVESVEDGYGWCAPELWSDVSCRTALALVWPSLPDDFARAWLLELDRLDERYRLATIPWPDCAHDESMWWIRRIPRRLDLDHDQPLIQGWPMGWSMVEIPRPDTVEVIGRD